MAMVNNRKLKRIPNKLMVAVSPAANSLHLIERAQQLSALFDTPLLAVYIDTGIKLDKENEKSLTFNLNYAKELGAEVITTQDTDIATGLIRLAKENNVTQIFIGKHTRHPLDFLTKQSQIISRLLALSEKIDINIIGNGNHQRTKIKNLFYISSQSSPLKYLSAVIIISALTFILQLIGANIGYQTTSLIYLFTVLLMPLLNFGPGPIFISAVLSAFSWDYYFIPPHYTLRIGKVEDFLMFVMYFIVALVSGFLISRIRTQRKLIDERGEKTTALYNLSKELSSAKSLDDVLESSIRQIKKTFNCEVVLYYYEIEEKLKAEPHTNSTFTLDETEWNIAQWVFINSQKAGRFTNTLPNSSIIYYPISTKSGNLGVIGLKFRDDALFGFELESYFVTFISQISIAIEREYLQARAKQNSVVAESEKLYKTLFDSISHELKTPITTIMGATSSFKEEKIVQNKNLFTRLVDEIAIATERLSRLVENLLNMTRLESGNLKPKLEWHSVSDLINSVINRIRSEAVNHKFIIKSEDETGFLLFDYGLLEQAIINIVHNSVQYTPENSIIKVITRRIDKFMSITISDNGKGIPEETIAKIFEKFYRVPGTKAGGTGLGLSIAKGFIEAHSGTIKVKNIKTGGAEFEILLPIRE